MSKEATTLEEIARDLTRKVRAERYEEVAYSVVLSFLRQSREQQPKHTRALEQIYALSGNDSIRLMIEVKRIAGEALRSSATPER